MAKYQFTNEDEMGRVYYVEANVDKTENVLNWLIFKDQTTGAKYKLMVNNGAIVLEETV